MKQIALLFVVFLATIFTSSAQSADEQKAWMEYSTPGVVQKMMTEYDGEWATDIKMWMPGDTTATKSNGACTNEMILGGRYQQSSFKGNFMGMPFEGKSLLAYDNKRKVFQSTWIDNMGTGIMVMEGTWDKASRTIHFTGKETDPMTGNMIPVREDWQIIDKDSQLMTMWMTINGKEMKSMEMTLKRKM